MPFFFPFFFVVFQTHTDTGLSQYLPCQRGCPCGLMLFVLCGSLLADRLSWANINLRWLLSHVKLMASMALSKLFRKQSGKKTKTKRKERPKMDYIETTSETCRVEKKNGTAFVPVKDTTTSHSHGSSSRIPRDWNVIVNVVVVVGGGCVPVGVAKTLI